MIIKINQKSTVKCVQYEIQRNQHVFVNFLNSECFCTQGMKVFFLMVVVLYVLYLVFLLVRAWSELKNLPYSGNFIHVSKCSHLTCCNFTMKLQHTADRTMPFDTCQNTESICQRIFFFPQSQQFTYTRNTMNLTIRAQMMMVWLWKLLRG